MQILDLPVEKRDSFGTANSRRSRRRGSVPCMLYGGKQTNVPLFAKGLDLGKVLKAHRALVRLKLGEQEQTALLREVKWDVMGEYVQHVDFVRVEMSDEVKLKVFFSEIGGYSAVQKESYIYQTLVKSRQRFGDNAYEKEQKRYNITIITRFGGTHFSHPLLFNLTGGAFPVIWIELYQEERLIIEGAANRLLFTRSKITFSGVLEGDYLVKVFFKRGNTTKIFTGSTILHLDKDTKLTVFCTWERIIKFTFLDQYGNGVLGIHGWLMNKDGVIYDENITQNDGEFIVKAPYNMRDSYTLRAEFKGIIIYDQELQLRGVPGPRFARSVMAGPTSSAPVRSRVTHSRFAFRAATAAAVLVVCLPAGAGTAAAQIYMSRDDSGTVVLSDRPIGGATNAVKLYPVARAASIVTTRPSVVGDTSGYDTLIEHHASARRVRADLVRAVIEVEVPGSHLPVLHQLPVLAGIFRRG